LSPSSSLSLLAKTSAPCSAVSAIAEHLVVYVEISVSHSDHSLIADASLLVLVWHSQMESTKQSISVIRHLLLSRVFGNTIYSYYHFWSIGLYVWFSRFSKRLRMDHCLMLLEFSTIHSYWGICHSVFYEKLTCSCWINVVRYITFKA